MPDDYRQKITQDYDLRIHPADLLSIMVHSKDPELAQMCNLPMVSYQIANSNTGYAGGPVSYTHLILFVSGSRNSVYRLLLSF